MDHKPGQGDLVYYLRERAVRLEQRARVTTVVGEAVELMRVARLFRDEADAIEAASLRG